MQITLQQVQFKNDFLEVVKIAGSGAVAKVGYHYWVSVRRVCENLGIDFKYQHQKIKSDPSYEARLIEVPTNGGVQKVFCIPLSKLNGWLFSINPNRVKPEVREKLIAYKKECFDVLFNHFIKKAQKPKEPKLLPNCEEELEVFIKNSPQYNGLKGLVAKLENEIIAKNSQIVELQTELKALKSLPKTELSLKVSAVLADTMEKLILKHEKTIKLVEELNKSYNAIIEMLSNEPEKVPASDIIRVGKIGLFNSRVTKLLEEYGRS